MSASRLHPDRPPLVIAHRGASGEKPENTDLAYERAVEDDADMIEVDLHLTTDDAIVISHDAELAHLGAEGEIGKLTRAEVAELDAGAGSGERCRVPELDGMLDRYGDRIPFNLEIKRGGDGLYDGLEEIALTAVRRRELLPRTLFSSFYDPTLEELRRLEPACRLATLVSPRAPDRALERAASIDAEAVNPHVLLATEDFVERAHALGLSVYVYTANEVELMQTLLDRGVDGLFTNWPARMRALLDSPAGKKRWGLAD